MFPKSTDLFKLTIVTLGLYLMCVTYAADAYPYQELEPRKGYVPVYIRIGDTPLSEINPKLVEAFPDDAVSSNLKLENTTPTLDYFKTESDIASFDAVKGTE